jgi:hypothetical protein
MADKTGLEMIGALMFAATLFVIGAGGFAVSHELAQTEPRLETAELRLPDRLQTVRAGFIPAPLQTVK